MNRDWIAEGIARELAEHGTLLPPWRRYPGVHPYDIHWRMGAGEGYVMLLGEWLGRMSPEEHAAYRARWEPDAPEDWADWFDPIEED